MKIGTGEEIPLIAMEPNSREMQTLVAHIFQNTEKLLYVNDSNTMAIHD